MCPIHTGYDIECIYQASCLLKTVVTDVAVPFLRFFTFFFFRLFIFFFFLSSFGCNWIQCSSAYVHSYLLLILQYFFIFFFHTYSSSNYYYILLIYTYFHSFNELHFIFFSSSFLLGI